MNIATRTRTGNPELTADLRSGPSRRSRSQVYLGGQQWEVPPTLPKNRREEHAGTYRSGLVVPLVTDRGGDGCEGGTLYDALYNVTRDTFPRMVSVGTFEWAPN